MAERDTNQEIMDQVRQLIRERKLDRRKLMQTAAALGISATPVVGAAMAAIKPSVASAQSSDLNLVTVSQEQQATWIKNFNPWLTGDNVRWPTHAGIYEPLLIYNEITGETHPWLATAWEWSADNLSLTFTLQDGVTWSDGEVFDSADVKFTYEYLIAHEDLPSTGAIRGVLPNIASIEAPDAATAVFTFKEVNTTSLWDVGEVMQCPEHIWSSVEDPATSTNEEPVGTGPFTVIAEFQPQYWEIHKNPTYWQEGKPAVDGFRFPSYPTNDAANLATLNGENDWAGNFIPDVENTFVSKDPEHNVWWFPPIGATVHLYAQTTVKPFDDVNVRKAISMAIDRPQIVQVAMYDYTRPADATGLSDAYPTWFSQEVADSGAAWVTRDVDAANALLDEAGLVLDGDVRALPDGTKMEYELLVVTGWSDWVSSVQIISQNLEEVGIKATVTPMDFAAWIEKVQKGDFNLSIGWASGGPTPLNFYRGIMGSSSVQPVGQLSNENWHRYANEEADAALTELASTSVQEEQIAAGVKLQQIYSDNAPAIPLFPGPEWGEFVTTRFTGFPSADNAYGQLPTWELPARLRVMNTITPVE
jgi:peptide/nickel transport system substrate-binding protein